MHSFNNNIKRIGFACKYMHSIQNIPRKKLEEIQRPYNTKTTTISWLSKQSKEIAEQRLWDLMVHNVNSFYNLIMLVATMPKERRMVRLSSELLPVATHKDWKYFWQKPDVVFYLENNLKKIGNQARRFDVRLSMHPGQFTVLSSDNLSIVKNSIELFEYHVDIAKYMGYAKKFQDFKINVHITGKKGAAGIFDVWSKLSPEAKNTITFENDEWGHGLQTVLEISKLAPIVLDIHHHFIHSYGEYIKPNDERWKIIQESWKDIRPVIHYSVSKEEYFSTNEHNKLPDLNMLLEKNINRNKLRAHSIMLWNEKCNKWALEFLPHSDIMVEAKGKNLASKQLYDRYKQQ